MRPKSLEKSCYIYRDIWSSKNLLNPEEVPISTDVPYLFNCLVCSHEYEQRPSYKTSGYGCPFCSNKKLCGSLDCNLCLEKSCYTHKDIWSSKNSNKPEEISISNGKKFWFRCLECSHEYRQRPSNKTSGCGCPFCSNKKLCGILGCDLCLQKSCHVYKEIWSNKNKLNPEQVGISSGKKFWFNCIMCNHDYDQSPNDKLKGNGCRYCPSLFLKLLIKACYLL